MDNCEMFEMLKEGLEDILEHQKERKNILNIISPLIDHWNESDEDDEIKEDGE